MSEEDSKSDEIKRRKEWFERYIHSLDNESVVEPPREGVRYRCPCCGYKTLHERGGNEICKVCFWGDDGQDDQDSDTVRGGPNGRLSLTEARNNFREFGGCDQKSVKHVRKPLPEEL